MAHKASYLPGNFRTFFKTLGTPKQTYTRGLIETLFNAKKVQVVIFVMNCLPPPANSRPDWKFCGLAGGYWCHIAGAEPTREATRV
jgi:hypothetical protein